MNIKSLFVGICLLFLFYGLMLFAFGVGKGFQILKRNKVMMFILLPTTVVTAFFVKTLISQNEYVYFWDYGLYWSKTLECSNDFFWSPGQTLKNVYYSMNVDEYNAFLPLLISLPFKIFGVTFERYVIINHVMFLIPAIWVMAACIDKILNMMGRKQSALQTVLCVLAVAAFPTFYYAMLRGYIDVASLLPMALVWLLTIDIQMEEYRLKKCAVRDVVIGILLVVILMFRRYNAYFVVGYVCTLSVMAVWKLLESKNRAQIFISAVKHFASIGISSLLPLVLFFRTFLVRSITTDYKGQFVAYDADWGEKLNNFSMCFGMIVIVLAILAIILTVFFYKKVAWYIVAMGIGTFVSILLFMQVQVMGIHHVYIISTQMCILSIVGIIQITNLGKSKIVRRVVVTVGITLYAANFINCYVPSLEGIAGWASKISISKYKPMVRNDISELRRLADYLNEISDEENQVYVLASGVILNDDILRSIDKPYNNAVPNMMITSSIDLRDGFPVGFFDAEIVVVTNPIELHSAEGTQEIVRFLAQEMLDENSLLSQCFTKQETFYLDNDVEAMVYVKTKEIGQEIKTYIREYFVNYYPEYPQLFEDRL